MMCLVKSLFRIKTMNKQLVILLELLTEAANTKTYECLSRSLLIIHDV